MRLLHDEVTIIILNRST